MNISVPEFSLIMLVGATASGKTTFAHKHFGDTEIISSDHCRALVSDDPTDQNVTPQAFAILHAILEARLQNRRLTVVDATNLQPNARRPIIDLARRHDCRITAIALDLPMQTLIQRNEHREDRSIPNHIVNRQHRSLSSAIRNMRRESIRNIYTIHTEEDADQATLVRQPMRSNHNHLTGPFDIFGDIHGCHEELYQLLEKLGYVFTADANGKTAQHPDGRTAVFVGDLVDRGPGADLVLELVANMTDAGSALTVMGNHEDKLRRTLLGNRTQITHGLQQTLDSLEPRSPEFRQRIQQFLKDLPHHITLDGGKLAIAHAGILPEYIGRQSQRIRQFCMYGETTGETDEWGLPQRYDWAQNYQGNTKVVYGHTPLAQPAWHNNTINLDTGCVFGGALTALRYPEDEIVSVPALRVHYESHKPLPTVEDIPTVARQPNHFRLNLNETTGAQRVLTQHAGTVLVPQEHAAAALEIMSRFAVDPRWLAYIPPTISPCRTTELEHLLEYPPEAFDYYRDQEITHVICEEKHMGSRGIIVVAKSQDAIEQKFGIKPDQPGICYTRTGRNFFSDPELGTAFIERIQAAVTKAGIWETLDTDWLIMDAEIMPWSLKADGLLRAQYASTGAAADLNLKKAHAAIQQAASRGIDPEPLQQMADRFQLRSTAVADYIASYRSYCWNVDELNDIKVAPFHIMASEGVVHNTKNHQWHLDVGRALNAADPGMIIPTQAMVVDLTDPEQQANATQWWETITQLGAEGMVVKPLEFTVSHNQHTVQPAIKCRGKQYLRIIYGPEYDLPENLPRLKHRNLRFKRALAIREFALGIEGLQRFVNDEPLQRVHQCSFGVLALESEPVDPRL